MVFSRFKANFPQILDLKKIYKFTIAYAPVNCMRKEKQIEIKILLKDINRRIIVYIVKNIVFVLIIISK